MAWKCPPILGTPPAIPLPFLGLDTLTENTTTDILLTVKPLDFLGDSLDVLRAFPDGARRAAGFQLDRLQRGLESLDWKPMTSIGPGVQEIRVREESGTFRVI